MSVTSDKVGIVRARDSDARDCADGGDLERDSRPLSASSSVGNDKGDSGRDHDGGNADWSASPDNRQLPGVKASASGDVERPSEVDWCLSNGLRPAAPCAAAGAGPAVPSSPGSGSDDAERSRGSRGSRSSPSIRWPSIPKLQSGSHRTPPRLRSAAEGLLRPNAPPERNGQGPPDLDIAARVSPGIRRPLSPVMRSGTHRGPSPRLWAAPPDLPVSLQEAPLLPGSAQGPQLLEAAEAIHESTPSMLRPVSRTLMVGTSRAESLPTVSVAPSAPSAPGPGLTAECPRDGRGSPWQCGPPATCGCPKAKTPGLAGLRPTSLPTARQGSAPGPLGVAVRESPSRRDTRPPRPSRSSESCASRSMRPRPAECL